MGESQVIKHLSLVIAIIILILEAACLQKGDRKDADCTNSIHKGHYLNLSRLEQAYGSGHINSCAATIYKCQDSVSLAVPRIAYMCVN